MIENSRRKVVVIDPDDLEREWVEQSDKYLEHAEDQAEAEFDVDEAEAKLDVVKAEAEEEVRSRPKKFGLKAPVREAAVKLKVLLHPSVQKWKRIINRRKLKVRLLKAVCRALEHRKAALESLVYMGNGTEFAAPRTRDPEVRDQMTMARVKKLTRKGRQQDDVD